MENTKAGGRGASDKGRAKAKRSEAEGMRGAPPIPGPRQDLSSCGKEARTGMSQTYFKTSSSIP